MAKNCTYIYKDKKYTEDEFMRFLHESKLDLPEVRKIVKAHNSIDDTYDKKYNDLKVEYNNELDKNPNVIKVRNFIRENGAPKTIINEELANKLGMTEKDLSNAVQDLRGINLKYKNNFDSIERQRQLAKDISEGKDVKAFDKDSLSVIYEKVNGLSKEEADKEAVISDKIIKQIAKRSSLKEKQTVEQIYNSLSFNKDENPVNKLADIYQNYLTSDERKSIPQDFDFVVGFDNYINKDYSNIPDKVLDIYARMNGQTFHTRENKNTILYRGEGGTASKLVNDLFGSKYKYYTSDEEYAKSFQLDESKDTSFKFFKNPNSKLIQIDYNQNAKIYEKNVNDYRKDVAIFSNKNTETLNSKDFDNYNDYLKSQGYDIIKINRIEPVIPQEGIGQQLNNHFVDEHIILNNDILNTKIDQRLVPASNAKYGEKGYDLDHVKLISEAHQNGDYTTLYKEGKVDEEGLKNILSSIFGENLGEKYAKSIVWQSDPENVRKLHNISEWTNIANPEFHNLIRESVLNGDLEAAIKNDFMPLSDMVSIVDNTDVPDYIKKLVREKQKEANDYTTKISEIKDAVIKQETEVKQEEHDILNTEEPKEDKIETEEPSEITKPEDEIKPVEPEPTSEVIKPKDKLISSEEYKTLFENLRNDEEAIDKLKNMSLAELRGLGKELGLKLNLSKDKLIEGIIGRIRESKILRSGIESKGEEIKIKPIEPTLQQQEDIFEEQEKATFGKGDQVKFKGKDYIIEADKDADNIYTLKPIDGGRKEYAGEKQLDLVKKLEPPKSTRNIDHIIRVAEKIQKVFPSIKFKIVDEPGEWLGKVKNGEVLINRRNAQLDTPIHEFLHPFVLAIKNENEILYRNLLRDLKEVGQEHIQEVLNNKNYDNLEQSEKADEALVRWLSKNIADTFDKNGNIDEDKLDTKRQSIIDFIYDWFKKLRDLILGVNRNVREPEKFVQKLVEGSTNGTQKTEPFTKYKIVLDKFDDNRFKSKVLDINGEKVIAVNKNLYGKYSTPESIFSDIKDDIDTKDYNELINKATAAIKTTGNKTNDIFKYDAVTFNPATNGITFIKDGKPSTRIKLSDFSLKSLIEDGRFTKELGVDFIDKYNQWEENPNGKQVFDYTIDKDLEQGGAGDYFSSTGTISVKDLPGNINLEQLAALVVAGNNIQFDLSSQQDAINQMEAFQHQSYYDEAKFKEQMENRLAILEHTSAQRIKGGFDAGKSTVRDVRDLLKNNTDVDFGLAIVREGFYGLQVANNLFTSIRRELFNKEKTLTPEDLNRLHSDFQKFTTLMGFYDYTSKILDEFEDYFDKKELKHFNEILQTKAALREKIENSAVTLITKWLYPHYLEQQDIIQKKNPTRQLPILSEDEFRNKLRVADKDLSAGEYWMGAMIDARDPLNSTVASVLNNVLGENNIKEVELNSKINVEFGKFLKRTGLENTRKAVEDFYKKNYLRLVESYEQTGYDQVNKKPIYEYVKRYGFHEKYNYDQYDKARIEFQKTLKEPITAAEEKERDKKILEWSLANSKVVGATFSNELDKDGNRKVLSPGITLPADKYLNQQWQQLQNDSQFKLLYDTYKEHNDKYGEKALKYGIIPQARNENGLRNLKEKFKENVQGTKEIFTDKNKSTPQKIGEFIKKGAEKILGSNRNFEHSYTNLDDSQYKSIQSDYISLINDEHDIDFLLHETVVGMVRDANTYAAMRDISANFQNLRALMLGNPKIGIEARKALKISNGKPVWDGVSTTPQTQEITATRLNKQLLENINEMLYGEGEIRADVKLLGTEINLNKLGKNLTFYTALNTMAGNLTAGLANVTFGNFMNLQEAVGGRYMDKKSLLFAHGEYNKNIPHILADIDKVVKSKITQLAIAYDAIQGEYRDELGKKVTSALARKLFTKSSFFVLNHAGEHQIQLTGMIAMMKHQPVTLADGTKTNLYDAHVADANGHYSLRKDAIWSNKDNINFISQMHSVNRAQHGNYSEQHKAAIQRRWWGKLAIIYKKYVWEGFRNRFSNERASFGRGDLTQGYYNNFVNRFTQDLKNFNYNFLKATANQWRRTGWSDIEKYHANKTITDMATLVTLMGFAGALQGGGGIKKDDTAKQALLLGLNKLNNDVAGYSFQFFQEAKQAYTNPSAAGRTVKNTLDFLSQLLYDPHAIYTNSGYGYNQGDSKLGKRFEKLLPVLPNILRSMTPAEQNQYFSLTRTNLK
jgi:hypothetical protein